MGRVKLQLKKIEHNKSRQVTFSKRKDGLLKKANELSTLCDVEVVLIVFSPAMKLFLFDGKKRVEETLNRYIDLPHYQRGSNATGRKYDRKQLKNHWDIVKKDWQLWDSLLRGETGLGWDMERQTIEASNEWWEAKLQKYPEASKFRVKGLEHAFKLDELFRDVTATGARAWAPTSGLMPHMYTTSTKDNVDATNSLDSEEANHGEEVECSKRKEKTLEPNRKKFKKGKKKK
ncbi:hypothetical protein EZV62_027067 [Acer yangbiense]|uniref:MADS-box domain-containing protein n=1 Tax=Acer yangbiense TaxID=1000413 RepID=A0A5C7GT27_9ROSI|nr:hypothetical protein EZV62_027067 [Acer yangbiense]